MADWQWVRLDVVVALHEEQLAEHGGATGIRDYNLLESALARPINAAFYADRGPADLAASYAFGLARNHPFTDGNKRTAAVTALVFLTINQIDFNISEADLLIMTMALAAGELTEADVTTWFRDRII